MQVSANRSIAVISGLLTLLVLGGGMLGVAFHNGWLRYASDAPNRDPVSAGAAPTSTIDGVVPQPIVRSSSTTAMQAGADDVDVYRQKLDEAYRALDDAYSQIRSLQAAQPRLAASRDNDEGFVERDGDGRHERRSHRRDSDHD